MVVPVPEIDASACISCGACATVCDQECFARDADNRVVVADDSACWSCGHCARVCPRDAVSVPGMSEV
ncbi:hypothetical protein KIPB_008573 [Kipferlia bialata]|uniref:4Fe-4S ferredoxin-type domain-containing protein n=1 Tax=Kipferlia bialata TaxID=797122 RepID=A0A9K3D240_9EUKA|nr:hypothetical protein KIPB_008573 [Kipferlia bialata]|eukprot:g8573.t1